MQEVSILCAFQILSGQVIQSVIFTVPLARALLIMNVAQLLFNVVVSGSALPEFNSFTRTPRPNPTLACVETIQYRNAN